MTVAVYPIKLATVFQCDYSHNVLNTRFGEKIDTAVLSFLIIDGKNILLFDTGNAHAKTEGDKNLNMIGNAEEEYKKKFDSLGLSFGDVTHIILSHLHWDHCENCELFPNAKIYIQRREMAYAAAPEYGLYYHPDDIGNLLIHCYDRIEYVDGDCRLTPNVRLVLLGGHSPGSQGAFITTSKDTVCLTGDVMNLYANMDERSVKELDVPQWVRAVKRIKAESTIVLPNHEPKVLDDYPVIQ